MSKNIFVAFGDSYGAGAELVSEGWEVGKPQDPSDKENFIQLLGKDYDLCYNFSTVGASIPGYLEQLKRFDKFYSATNRYTLLVMLTQHNRDFVYDNKLGWIDLYPGISYTNKRYKQIETQWYENVNYPQTAQLNWYRTVSLIQHYCKQRDIKDYYIEQFNPSPITDYDFLVDKKIIYTTPFIKEIFFNNDDNSVGTLNWKEFKGTEKYTTYYSPKHHPNMLGHQLIANKIKSLTII